MERRKQDLLNVLLVTCTVVHMPSTPVPVSRLGQLRCERGTFPVGAGAGGAFRGETPSKRLTPGRWSHTEEAEERVGPPLGSDECERLKNIHTAEVRPGVPAGVGSGPQLPAEGGSLSGPSRSHRGRWPSAGWELAPTDRDGGCPGRHKEVLESKYQSVGYWDEGYFSLFWFPRFFPQYS